MTCYDINARLPVCSVLSQCYYTLDVVRVMKQLTFDARGWAIGSIHRDPMVMITAA